MLQPEFGRSSTLVLHGSYQNRSLAFAGFLQYVLLGLSPFIFKLGSSLMPRGELGSIFLSRCDLWTKLEEGYYGAQYQGYLTQDSLPSSGSEGRAKVCQPSYVVQAEQGCKLVQIDPIDEPDEPIQTNQIGSVFSPVRVQPEPNQLNPSFYWFDPRLMFFKTEEPPEPNMYSHGFNFFSFVKMRRVPRD